MASVLSLQAFEKDLYAASHIGEHSIWGNDDASVMEQEIALTKCIDLITNVMKENLPTGFLKELRLAKEICKAATIPGQIKTQMQVFAKRADEIFAQLIKEHEVFSDCQEAVRTPHKSMTEQVLASLKEQFTDDPDQNITLLQRQLQIVRTNLHALKRKAEERRIENKIIVMEHEALRKKISALKAKGEAQRLLHLAKREFLLAEFKKCKEEIARCNKQIASCA